MKRNFLESDYRILYRKKHHLIKEGDVLYENDNITVYKEHCQRSNQPYFKYFFGNSNYHKKIEASAAFAIYNAVCLLIKANSLKEQAV